MPIPAVNIEGLVALVDLFVSRVEHQSVGTILSRGDSIITHVELVTLNRVRVLVRLIVGTFVLTIYKQKMT